ncbi:MAG: response regulator [Planctomycetes bacterium]|nr:response regulator [Planctomycetota bacterium]
MSISTVSFGGRSWNVRMSSTPQFVTASRVTVTCVSITGVLVAILVGLLITSRDGAARRARGLADAMTADLRDLANVSASQAGELSAMADLARVGAWEYDAVDGTLRWSRQVKAIHEVADDWTPTFESAVAFYPGVAAQQIRRAVERAVTERESFDVELPFVTARDRSIWVRAIGRPIVEGDRVVRVAGAFQDVTEQRAVRAALQAAKDEAEAAAQSKSQFVAMLSHEIRTPLNGILGVISLLLDSELDEPQSELVKTVHASGEALVVLLNDVLDFSKIEAGRIEFERAPFDLHRIVDDVRRLFTAKAQEKQIGLKTLIRADVPERVVGDSGRLRQILLNLVSNAVKFTDRGGVDVELSVITSSPRRCGIRFDVVDTGPGMDEETTKRLFQPFVQASASTTRNFGGTGLGLAIAKRLVESMGGALTCSSEPGRGSTFRVDLTFDVATAIAPAPASAERPADDPAQERSPLHLRVLLAEDNPVNQQVARRMLERLGCEVQVAANGQVAVEAFERGDFDVVLMDWHMPVMDGIEATRRIRALPRTRRVPVVALTANAMTGDVETCRAAGMDEFIAKPVTMVRLHEVLAAYASPTADRT